MAAKQIYEKDLYAVLGVKKGDDAAAIKKQYRKLARELHPDKTKGDKKLEERFKEVSEAYEILSDDKKRGEYDEMRSAFKSGRMPNGGMPGGQNFQGKSLGYTPPCSQGPGDKIYTFTIYALSTSLDLQPSAATEAALEAAVVGIADACLRALGCQLLREPYAAEPLLVGVLQHGRGLKLAACPQGVVQGQGGNDARRGPARLTPHGDAALHARQAGAASSGPAIMW